MATVEFITYNKKKYPVKLGLYSLMILQNRDGITLEDINDNPEIYQPVLFMALQQGASAQKQELTLTLDDMHLVLDECFMEFTILFPKFFPEDMLGKLMEDGGIKQLMTEVTKKE